MANKTCNQPGCTFNSDGKCLEGLGDSCTYLQLLDNVVSSVATENIIEKNTTEIIKLVTGEDFSIGDTKIVAYNFPYKLITIIGDSESGKSTFLAVLFDLFQLGPFGDLLYAGSATQLGFERRCHQSRVASGGTVPDTARTTSVEFRFLHLALKFRSALLQDPTHLLISDVSGERQKLARKSAAAMQELDFIRYGHQTVLILDGTKLSNQRFRVSELFNTESFIKMALESNIFTSASNVKIVVSKWDVLISDRTFDYERDIVQHFTSLFGPSISHLSFAKIAARPLKQSEEMQLGYGLYNLLHEWLKSKFDGMSTEAKIVDDRFFNLLKVKLS
jgi:hypothetical protein